MPPASETRAVAGCGPEGDRCHDGLGFCYDQPGPEHEVTLIEVEVIEALGRDKGLPQRAAHRIDVKPSLPEEE